MKRFLALLYLALLALAISAAAQDSTLPELPDRGTELETDECWCEDTTTIPPTAYRCDVGGVADLAWFPAWVLCDKPGLARWLGQAQASLHTPPGPIW